MILAMRLSASWRFYESSCKSEVSSINPKTENRLSLVGVSLRGRYVASIIPDKQEQRLFLRPVLEKTK
jgi:hypothetical protein